MAVALVALQRTTLRRGPSRLFRPLTVRMVQRAT